MGCFIERCGSKQKEPKPSNFLEIIICYVNQDAYNKVREFLKYTKSHLKGILTGIKFENINDIIIRYYNPSGKIIDLYQGKNLKQNDYPEIISKIINE